MSSISKTKKITNCNYNNNSVESSWVLDQQQLKKMKNDVVCGDLQNNKKILGRKRRRSFSLRKCSKRQSKEDKINLSEILFSKDRDYLITYNGLHCPAKHLEGKVIVLHFVPLVSWSNKLRLYVTSLVDIYNAIYPRGGFEVVFVGVKFGKNASNTPKLVKYFEQKFSIMPWLAIPFSDIESTEYWEARLRFPLSPWIGESDTASVVIDPTGVVLKWFADDYFVRYGPEAYPFTDKRIGFLKSQDKDALKHPSITNLLTSPQRDYVINNKNQEIPVHTLEEKVVALYFYQDYPLDCLTKGLKMTYKQLADKKFEIVLVYIHNSMTTSGRASEESFWKSFKKMPWLALPFKDQKCMNLQRVFNLPLDALGPGPDPSLVIIGPHGKFVEPYGVDILENFGNIAYPFSRKRVAELEVNYIKELKLDMFWDPDTCFIQKDGTIKLSQLVGKRIILVAENDWFYGINATFWRMLETRYSKMKGTSKEFEVIHICEKQESSYGKHGAIMPWLRHPPLREGSRQRKLLLRLLRQGVGLLAFDGDGRVVRRTIFLWIEKNNVDFPFYAGGLENEAVTELIDRFEWYDWDDSNSPLTIFKQRPVRF